MARPALRSSMRNEVGAIFLKENNSKAKWPFDPSFEARKCAVGSSVRSEEGPGKPVFFHQTIALAPSIMF